MPVHVYDGALVQGEVVDGFLHEENCFIPPDETLAEFDTMINLEDWYLGGPDNPDVDCNFVPSPNTPAPEFCTFSVTATYQESCQLYVNVHLDYGLKGPKLDVNPSDDIDDRYDRDDIQSAWGTYDALRDGTSFLGVQDCENLSFSHIANTATPAIVFGDTIQNLNEFKRLSGIFGLVFTSVDDEPVVGAIVELVHPENGVVATAETDDDGFYLMQYKHKGKPTVYTIQLQGGGGVGEIPLKGNSRGEAHYDATTMTWEINP